jgi:glutathione peroxidase
MWQHASAHLLLQVNYPGLRTLYEKYRDQGFNIIAFSCNQFGGQAPGTSEEERQWAFRKFGFEFPVMVRSL